MKIAVYGNRTGYRLAQVLDDDAEDPPLVFGTLALLVTVHAPDPRMPPVVAGEEAARDR